MTPWRFCFSTKGSIMPRVFAISRIHLSGMIDMRLSRGHSAKPVLTAFCNGSKAASQAVRGGLAWLWGEDCGEFAACWSVGSPPPAGGRAWSLRLARLGRSGGDRRASFRAALGFWFPAVGALRRRSFSDGPAGTAKRSPEAFEVGNRQTAGPCGGVVVTVNGAFMGATACCYGRTPQRRPAGCLLIAPRAIAAEGPHRRPVGHGGRRRGFIEARKIASAIDHPAADDGEIGNRVGDFVLRTGEIVAVGHDQIGELAGPDAPLFAFLIGEPGDVLGPHPQRRFAVETVALRVNPQTADRLAGDEPGQRDPGIVGGDAGRVSPGRGFHAGGDDPRYGRRRLGRAGAIALDEIFALIGHAVLDGDAAAERRDPADRPVRDGFGMVEEPIQSLERDK